VAAADVVEARAAHARANTKQDSTPVLEETTFALLLPIRRGISSFIVPSLGDPSRVLPGKEPQAQKKVRADSV